MVDEKVLERVIHPEFTLPVRNKEPLFQVRACSASISDIMDCHDHD